MAAQRSSRAAKLTETRAAAAAAGEAVQPGERFEESDRGGKPPPSDKAGG